MKGEKQMDWNYDMDSCPLDTKVCLLSADGCFLLPQQEFVGTITHNGRFVTRGKCFSGDSDYFYRSKIIAWKKYDGEKRTCGTCDWYENGVCCNVYSPYRADFTDKDDNCDHWEKK